MYVTKRNAVVVSRASHRQNTPHVSRPHSIPTTSVMPMNSTPTSALAPARRSQPSECWREDGYVPINEAFAAATVEELDRAPEAAVFFHDYHLYLAPAFVRNSRPDVVR